MTDPRAIKADDIFYEALSLPADKRNAFIEAKCGGDAALIGEVRALLGCHQEDESGFLNPAELSRIHEARLGASGLRDAVLGDEARLAEGTKVGEYTIRGVLGSGGMGVVYTAEQQSPRRTVALKVMRRGYGSRELERRFRREAEALGRLQHAGIAQIFEAGAASVDGARVAFIAMERVDGLALTHHARKRGLSTNERLSLLARVADACHHAHQRGIIHRDLKPANILVDQAGNPKVLDFGVARIAEDPRGDGLTTVHTGVGQLIGTLSYMSPEQVSGDHGDVDVRSDVYALGVIAYELLTGKLPVDVAGRSVPEAARAICENEPTRLSTIDRTLSGDIQTIVLKSIEKDKGRRYQSAAELHDDLQRCVVGQPILARQDSAMYILRKRLNRYRGLVAVAALILFGAVSFAIHSAMNASEMRRLAAMEREAREKATELTAAERSAREAADAAAGRLREELAASRTAQGRLHGRTGNVPTAEQILWGERVASGNSLALTWAMRELYASQPCVYSVQLPAGAQGLTLRSDGLVAATGILNGTVYFFDPLTGDGLGEPVRLGANPNSLAFGPDGDLAVGLADGRVVVVDATSSEEPRTLITVTAPTARTNPVVLSWSSTNVLAVGGTDGVLRLVDPESGSVLSSWPAGMGVIGAVAFSDDGSLVACGPRDPNEQNPAFGVWKVSDGTLVRTEKGNSRRMLSVSFSRDNNWLYFGGHERRVYACNLKGSGESSSLSTEAGAGSAWALGESPDGTRILGNFGPELRLWRRDDLREATRLERHAGAVTGAAWMDDRFVLSVSSDGVAKLWDTAPQAATTLVHGFTSWCFGLDYEPGGSRLAISAVPQHIEIVDGATLQHITTIKNPVHRARQVRWLGTSGQIVAGCSDGGVRVFDASSGQMQKELLQAKGSEIYGMAVHPDGETLVTGHYDGSVHVWNIRTHEYKGLLTKVPTRVAGMSFSPDGSLLAFSGAARGAALWDWNARESKGTLECGQNTWPVTFSPDGSLIAAATYDGFIETWDAKTFVRVGSVKGHDRLAAALAFSHDSNVIVSGSDDGMVKVWNARTLRELASFPTRHNEAVQVAFDPVRNRLAAACQAEVSVVWEFDRVDRWVAGHERLQKVKSDGLAKRALPVQRADAGRVGGAGIGAGAAAPAPAAGPEP